jgi:hypothetical protein
MKFPSTFDDGSLLTYYRMRHWKLQEGKK